ncbi:MAG: RluA family pseudouridine synthase [Bacteroidia bacterium]|jgi:23S rRNA pseudouridine1911/1915/1917 synthase|nr:RluA family pseudouridine synthase [Bacteroidia bacterium]
MPVTEPQILFEDNHVIAILKPAGMPSQEDETGDLSAYDWVREYVRVKYQKPGEAYLGLLHRLDRPASGILLMARTSKAAARLSEDFRVRNIQKTYRIITERIPDPPAATLTHHVKKMAGKNIMQAFLKPVHASQDARLHYQVIQTAGGRALVEVDLHTGRRHQIRVQMAAIGCTIVGDVKYGKTDFLPDKSIALLAWRLTFTHPTRKEPITLQAPWPDQGPWRGFAP